LYGSILPDINPGWVIEPEEQIEHYITQMEEGCIGQDYFWEAKRFCDKYKAEMTNMECRCNVVLYRLFLLNSY